MRILLASSSSGSRGGGEIFLLYLAKALKVLGQEPLLWCSTHPRMDELAARFADLGDVYRADYPNSYWDRKLRVLGALADRRGAKQIARHWQQINPDIVHINKQTLEDGLDLMVAASLTRLPTITTIHITQTNQSLGARFGRIRDFFARSFLRRANTHFTVVSDLRREALALFLGREDVTTIYNAVPDVRCKDREKERQTLLNALTWPGDTLLTVYLARLVPQKDPEGFLRLAHALHEHEPRTRFLWVGDGPMREEFDRKTEALEMTEYMYVTGWEDDPARFLNAADIYLHPAAYEGLPLSILEAMSVGLPCVISRNVAREVRLFDSDTFLYCDEDSSWISLIASEETRLARGSAARALYEKAFQPEVMAAKYLGLYEASVRG